jgi:penicillin amidase
MATSSRTPRTSEDLQAGLPDVTSTLEFGGLDGRIEVYRDPYGIPHLTAETVRDAFFGQGFVTAQDRLWHMEFDRRRAYGRWAELVGRDGVEQDLMMRKFQIGRGVRDDYEAMNTETRAMMDAYAAGVDAFVDATESLPVEFDLVGAKPEAWEPWDCMAVFKVRHILMGVFEGKLWRAKVLNTLGPEKAAELFKGYQPGHLMIVPPGHEYDGPGLDALEEFEAGLHSIDWLRESPDSGSNSWAVHGSRTASGKPLLAGDPHRGLDTPNVYYQNHIACPDFDVVGLSFPGCPGFPHFGHNAHVAWCVTHAQADYQDVYIERFSPDDPTRYEFKGEWKHAEVVHETVEVKGGQPVQADVTVTHHGPVIAGDPAGGTALAFRYTATSESNHGFECLIRMMRAAGADDLDESMREWVDPCNNFVFADVHGDIGYLNRGKVPIRPMRNAWLPAPGWDGQHEWQGNIPFEELARSRNPENGFIVTANNRIVDHEYPYYLSLDSAPEYRARRIYGRLEGLTGATVEDMASVHAERVSIPALIHTSILAEAVPLDKQSADAKVVLSGWDCSMDVDLVAPTIFAAFHIELTRLVVQNLVGGPLADEMLSAAGRGAPTHLRHLSTRMNTAAQNGDDSVLPNGEDWHSIVARALSHAVADLRARFGDDMDAWVWGKVHRTQPQHTLSAAFPQLAGLLDPPSAPLGGGLDTPHAGGYSLASPFTITGTSVARYVFDTSDWDNSRWVVPLGSSGHPGSPHYADQTSTWRRVGLIPMGYGWDRIKAGTESHQTLQPV